ncbi:Cytochrome P450 [Gossypium australe]|uniref:Cytochrome P450 n=1 Tax=Gossypium australe TaxID=47621 RepID=A0A5B6VD10_9ROSI|nr:Cytochrome P450 [Gossypium australe]
MLKLNYVKHPSVSAGRDTQLDNNTCSVRSEVNLKSLCPHFKIKGELSCADTIDLFNDHLKKRTCWGYIRQDMLLWEVDVLQNRNGYHNVILNYHELLSQSLTLDTSPNSSIFVGNKLNDVNISKNFPNMDACSAFAYVFNHEYTKKYVGPKSLAQETQLVDCLHWRVQNTIDDILAIDKCRKAENQYL